MSTFFPYFRRTADPARQQPAPHPVAAADERMCPDCPTAKEVTGEIGVILAVHLAAALTITLTLSAFGIA